MPGGCCRKMEKPSIGRKTQFIDCREVMGLGLGGGLAQRGTLAEASPADVIVIAMSPGRRHITKPVCEITSALREAGISVSVLVLDAGSSVPSDAPSSRKGWGPIFGLSPEEFAKISKHKLAIIHLGNVRGHIVYKARAILRMVDIPAVVICQCPVDFEDFAKVGVKTRLVKPKATEEQTLGEIVEIVTDVVRGQTCPKGKLDEICGKVKSSLNLLRETK